MKRSPPGLGLSAVLQRDLCSCGKTYTAHVALVTVSLTSLDFKRCGSHAASPSSWYSVSTRLGGRRNVLETTLADLFVFQPQSCRTRVDTSASQRPKTFNVTRIISCPPSPQNDIYSIQRLLAMPLVLQSRCLDFILSLRMQPTLLP